MPAWGVTITEDTFTPKLRGLTDRMRKNAADGMFVIGGQMVDMARTLARVRTGFMRDSVFFQLVESDLNLTFGATAPYASFNEFGTRFMRAQPFIRPAFDAHQQKLLDALLHGVMMAFA